jgi:hypothetical protein
MLSLISGYWINIRMIEGKTHTHTHTLTTRDESNCSFLFTFKEIFAFLLTVISLQTKLMIL